jgi:cytoskeletal protein CcmA (bactofilin family)
LRTKDISAFLGKGTEFQGTLNFHGTIRVDGHLKGEISGNGGNLMVGEGGMIEADIRISIIINSGEIRGNIIADRRIEILSSGKVFGNIKAPILIIQEGAVFNGKAQMSNMEVMDRKI